MAPNEGKFVRLITHTQFVRGVRLTYMGVVFAMVRDENCFVFSWSSFCGVRSFVCGA